MGRWNVLARLPASPAAARPSWQDRAREVIVTITDRDEVEHGDDAGSLATAEDDGWYHEDESGWVRQRQAWMGAGVYVINEENELRAQQPWHYAVNEGYGLGISVQGAYRRRVRGADQIVDPNTGFLRFAGDEVGVEHFVGGRGAVTFLGVDPDVCPGFFDDVAPVPAFTVTPEMALTHLRLVRAQRLGADDVILESLALDLLGAAVEQHHEGVNSYSRRTTGDSRRRLVSQACELLHRPGPTIGLVNIAREIGCSPFHLSRVFHEITGLTIPQYRKRLRVHDALRRLNDGEQDLAAIAAASGFADHSHMTRSIVAQYGDPPSRLRELLQVYVASARLLPH
jgi:AraC-like DNA-binding protein